MEITIKLKSLKIQGSSLKFRHRIKVNISETNNRNHLFDPKSKRGRVTFF